MAKPPQAKTPESLLPLPSAAFHILVALADGDRHGYAILRDFGERTEGRLALHPGTLYTAIRRLLEQELIVELEDRPDPERDDGRRRYYSLTPFGRRVARAEVTRLEGLVTLARAAGLSPKRG